MQVRSREGTITLNRGQEGRTDYKPGAGYVTCGMPFTAADTPLTGRARSGVVLPERREASYRAGRAQS